MLNSRLAPPGGVADAREAFAQLNRATGIQFIEEGSTDETVSTRRLPYQPERYGHRWAPLLVAWEQLGSREGAQTVGRGGPILVGDVIVTGVVGLNVDAVTDSTKGTPLRDGFRAEASGGYGPIGAEGVTWGRVLLHELAHVVGLGHSTDPANLMYPEGVAQTSRIARYNEGDLTGLRLLGREAGCVATPSPSAAAARPGGDPPNRTPGPGGGAPPPGHGQHG